MRQTVSGLEAREKKRSCTQKRFLDKSVGLEACALKGLSFRLNGSQTNVHLSRFEPTATEEEEAKQKLLNPVSRDEERKKRKFRERRRKKNVGNGDEIKCSLTLSVIATAAGKSSHVFIIRLFRHFLFFPERYFCGGEK